MNLEGQTKARVPKGLDEVTAGWLTDWLGGVYPGVEVTSAAMGKVIHGTATKLQLHLTYNAAGQAAGLPPSLWLKTGFEAHSVVPEIARIYRSEAYFYRDVASGLKLGCPKAYAVQLPSGDGPASFLMEDLLVRGATFGEATTPISTDAAAAILEVQAGLHSRYWGARPAALDWLSDGLEYDRIVEDSHSMTNWARCRALARGRHIPAALEDFDRTREVRLGLHRYDREHAICLAHGDSHVGNTYYLPDGSAGYLDWQTVKWGHWADDLAYFLTMAMTIADRRHAERDLVAHYLERLAAFGAPAPDFEEGWLQYRRHAIHALGWAFCKPEWQPEDICSANTERACAAVMDLDAFGAWGA